MVNRNLYIGIGSNMGDRLANLIKARQLIESKFNVQALVSSIYNTEPWGFKDQPSFLNQVVFIKTDKKPLAILDELHSIESEFGRERTQLNGPRIIDLDLLLLDTIYFKCPSLSIPHPFIQERKFVLVPLVELAENLIHPLFNLSLKELLTLCKDTSLVTKIQNDEIKSK